MFSTSERRESARSPESTSPQARLQHPFRGAGSAGIQHAVQGESTGGEGQRVQQDRLPGTPHARLYTVVRGGFETGPGWRIELAVVSGTSVEAAVTAFLVAFGDAADDPQVRADVEVYPGVHRPLLSRYVALPLLDELSAQWPFTGGLALRWSLRKG